MLLYPTEHAKSSVSAKLLSQLRLFTSQGRKFNELKIKTATSVIGVILCGAAEFKQDLRDAPGQPDQSGSNVPPNNKLESSFSQGRRDSNPSRKSRCARPTCFKCASRDQPAARVYSVGTSVAILFVS